MAARVIDFDAFREEQQQEPLVLKIGGVEYILPSGLPAEVAVDLIRAREGLGTSEDLPPEQIPKWAAAIFGEEAFQEIMRKHRLTLEELAELLQRVMHEYNEQIGTILPNRKTRRDQQRKKKRSSSR